MKPRRTRRDAAAGFLAKAKSTAPHLVPVAQAIVRGVGMTQWHNNGIRFTQIAAEAGCGAILYIGDDLFETRGPASFPGLAEHLAAAGHVSLIASGPLPEPYRAAAEAALAGKRALLIECRPPTERAWIDFVTSQAGPSTSVVVALPDPDDPTPMKPVTRGGRCEPTAPRISAIGPGILVSAPAVIMPPSVEAETARRERFLDELHQQLEAMDPAQQACITFNNSDPEHAVSIPLTLVSLKARKREHPTSTSRRRILGFVLADVLTAIGL